MGVMIWAFISSVHGQVETGQPALAQKIKAASHFVSPFVNELDCENVGYAQIGEVDEHFFPIFNVLDHDRSQLISKQEMVGDPHIRNKALQAISFEEMDSNGDGNVNPYELRSYLIKALKLLDGNGDDDVFPDEFTHAYEKGEVLTPVAKVQSPEKGKTVPVASVQPK